MERSASIYRSPAALAFCVAGVILASVPRPVLAATPVPPPIVQRAFERVAHLGAYAADGSIVSTDVATGRPSAPRSTVRQVVVHRAGGWNYYNRIAEGAVVSENLETPTRTCARISGGTWTCQAARGNHIPDDTSFVKRERWTRVGIRRIADHSCAYYVGRSDDLLATGGDISACINEATATVVALDDTVVTGNTPAKVSRSIAVVISHIDDPTLAGALPQVAALGADRWR